MGDDLPSPHISQEPIRIRHRHRGVGLSVTQLADMVAGCLLGGRCWSCYIMWAFGDNFRKAGHFSLGAVLIIITYLGKYTRLLHFHHCLLLLLRWLPHVCSTGWAARPKGAARGCPPNVLCIYNPTCPNRALISKCVSGNT